MGKSISSFLKKTSGFALLACLIIAAFAIVRPTSARAEENSYEFGTVTLDSFEYGEFTVTYTPSAMPEDASTYIEFWSTSYTSCYVDGKSQTLTDTDWEIYNGNRTPGHYRLSVRVRNDIVGLKKEYDLDAVIRPDAPKYSADYLKNVTTTSAVIGGSTATGSPIDMMHNGNYYKVQLYVDGKWTDYNTYSAYDQAKITGLKANTSYKVRLIGIQRSEGSADIETKPSNAVTFKTGYSKKPEIKSVKISDVKVVHHKATTTSGHWVGNDWVPAKTTPAYDETKFKITVTLKKAVKGPNGLNIDGVYVKGTGTTFTTTGVKRGKLKGKSANLKIYFANHKNYGGLSPAATQKVTFK